MAAIIQPQPWTRQPQIPVGIQNNWGLFHASYMFAKGFNGGLKKEFPTLSAASGTAGVFAATEKGIALYQDQTSGTNQRALYGTDAPNPTISSTEAAWVVCQFNCLGYVNIGSSINCVASYVDSSVNGLKLYVDSNNGNRLVFNTDSADLLAGANNGASIADSKWHTAVGIIAAGGTASTLWLDGVKYTATTASTGVSSSTRQVMAGGDPSAFRGFKGYQSLLVFGKGALPDGIGRDLSLNPWPLFAPLPRRIFVGPSAGGAYTLTADAGSYSVSGQDATLLKSKLLTADAGSYALSGQDATLTWGATGSYTLTAEAGVYTMSGQAATLLKSKLLTADAGAYTLTGQDATLTKAAAAAYTLTAQAGAYIFVGQDAVLTNSGEVIPAATTGPTVGIDWGALVRKTWGKDWNAPEWDYEFSNGRRFKEKKNPYS